MNDIDWKILNQEGFLYFGKMTASISHEIKNQLAIINENAGLLQDLIALSRKGRPLDPDRIDKVAQQILSQIKRSDAIVKKLNRLAHSVDVPETSVDLVELLELSIALGQRLAKNKNIELKLEAQTEKFNITAQVYYLLNMIWLCIDFVVSNATGIDQLVMLPYKVQSGTQIRFKPVGNVKKNDIDDFVSEKRVATLLNLINGTLSADSTEQALVLALNK